MRRKNVFVLTVFLLMASLFFVRSNAVEVKAFDGMETSKVYGVEMVWNNSMSVNDVAVSRDGNYIATVNSSGLYYFAANSSSPKWWENPPTYFISVAISADGEYVVVGSSEGYIYYFNNSKSRTGAPNSPTWGSVNLHGPVERGTLDMSDDGEYVVVGGTGEYVYYFAGCTVRSGSDQPATWSNSIALDFYAVQISSDGKYVAAGGPGGVSQGFVAFYKDANTEPYPTLPNWYAFIVDPSSGPIIDLALSDDGYSVAAIDHNHLYYWANATSLSGDPNATWTGNEDGDFFSLDMSSDGDEVIGGMGLPMPCGLHFWTGARVRSGSNQTEDWIRLEGSIVWDVAISEDGGIIAASVENASSYKALFFKSDGSIIGEFDLVQYSPLASMSGDGSVTAIGGSVIDSLYVFKTLEDLTPPAIVNVYQQPPNDTVTPDDEVMVYANVTDDQSEVKQVILSYTNDSETYFIVNMTNFEGNIWNGSIPVFPYCTWVDYNILAEDMVGNTITTGELLGYWYQYHVIPEFSSFLILPLFIITTLLAVIIYRRKHTI